MGGTVAAMGIYSYSPWRKSFFPEVKRKLADIGAYFELAGEGEEVTAEELGGGDVHTRISGVATRPASTPYSLPGIGSGLAVIGAAMNIGGTYTDVLGFGLIGDMQGGGLVTKDVHILPRRLVLDVTVERFTEATITSYGQRGMNTDKHDFSYLELGDVSFWESKYSMTGTANSREVPARSRQ